MPETVRGPVAELGVTLMHEHVFGLSPEILWNWPDIPEGWDLEARAGQAAAKLEALRAAGVDPGARGEMLTVEDFARIAEHRPRRPLP